MVNREPRCRLVCGGAGVSFVVTLGSSRRPAGPAARRSAPKDAGPCSAACAARSRAALMMYRNYSPGADRGLCCLLRRPLKAACLGDEGGLRGVAVVVGGWVDADVVAVGPAADVGEVAAADAVGPVVAGSDG